VKTFANPFIEWRDAGREIRSRLDVQEVLDDLGARLRGRGRADCPFCEGSSKSTLAFKREVWHCHRCGRGGSIFDLIMAAHGCDFRSAREYLANLARVELPNAKRLTAEERRRIVAEQAERKRRDTEIDAACAELAEQERLLRVECAHYIREIDYLLSLPAPWTEEQWSFAAAINELRNEDLLPTYALLAFGAVGMRARYILASEAERAAILSHVRWAGGCYGDYGHFVEMVTT
jgi:hypothetical protein